MSITVTLSPEAEQALKEKAASVGQSVEVYLRNVAEREARARSTVSSQFSTEQGVNVVRSSGAGVYQLLSLADDTHPDPIPLRVDEGGVARVGKSRVSIDLVVQQYELGTTPEDMVRAYDTLLLADVHAVIAYYLRHKDEVSAYLMHRKEEANALQANIETERPRISREELLARRRARENDSAPTGQ